jgi:esterase/lipase
LKAFTALSLALGLAITAPAATLAFSTAHAAPPIEAFIEQDIFRGAALSGNGRYIAGIRREAVGDVLIVLDWETKKTTPIQFARSDQNLEIAGVTWKGNDRLIFTVQQKIRIAQGIASVDRTTTVNDAFIFVQQLYSSNADGSNLIPIFQPGRGNDLPRGISAEIVELLPNDPDHILIVAPDFGGNELRRVNIRTGQATFLEKGTARTQTWVVDQNSTPVMRVNILPGARGFVWQRRAPGTTEWVEVIRFRGAAGANSGVTFQAIGPANGPGRVYVLARPDGKDTEGLYVYDTNTGTYAEELLSVPGFDVSSVIRLAESKEILAGCYWEYRWRCVPKDATFGRAWRALERHFGDTVNVSLSNRSSDGKRFLVSTFGPQDLGSFWLYDANARSIDFVGGARPDLAKESLPTKKIVRYKARDGFDLWGYLWIPPGYTEETAKNLPTIVLPHGGPEGRDVWGSDPFGHWWAANGFAVFQPNFRGGGGFGRTFVTAGWRQWGQRMSHDVRDGADHLVAAGVSDRNRMCVAGWSYGGYATMAAAQLDGDLFKCAYAGAGVSDLTEMLRWTRDGEANPDSIRGASAGNGGSGTLGIGFLYWTEAIGDLDRDREQLVRFSPARNVDKINIPMFLITGNDDIQVPWRQSQIMYDAMRRAGKNVELVVLKEEGHQWSPMTVEHRRQVLETSLNFFRKHIGPGVTPPTN